MSDRCSKGVENHQSVQDKWVDFVHVNVERSASILYSIYFDSVSFLKAFTETHKSHLD